VFSSGSRLAVTVGLALALAEPACGASLFACGDDDDCTASAAGVCQAEGVCSFPDGDCPSGQRFGEHSGGVSGTCVPELGTTSGADEAGTSTSEGSASFTATLDGDSGALDTSTSTADATSVASADESTGGPSVDPDLLLWFQLDDESVDGLVNAGVLGGVAACEGERCPAPIDGPSGLAGSFDGVDDCAVYPWSAALDTASFTVALWYAHDSTSVGHGALFDKPVGESNFNTWEVYLLDDEDMVRRLHFTVGAPELRLATVSIESFVEAWTHLAMTYDGAVLRAFVNGELLMEVAAMGEAIHEPEGVFVGCDDNHEGGAHVGFLRGGLDDLRLYGRVLADDEIATLAGR
jgi:hypothetical protein